MLDRGDVPDDTMLYLCMHRYKDTCCRHHPASHSKYSATAEPAAATTHG